MIKSKVLLQSRMFLRKIYLISTNGRRLLCTKPEPIKMSYTSYEKAADEKNFPVIIIHSLFGSKSNWNSISNALHNMTHRKIITVDTRNHGDSPHVAEFSYQAMAEDIKLFMEDLNLRKASLMGHSSGGRALLYFAIVYPELVESLIPIDISTINNREYDYVQNLIDALCNVNLNIDEPISKALKLVDEQIKSYVEDPNTRQFLLTNLIKVDNKYQWRLNLKSLNDNFKNYLALFPLVQSTFDGPTYFIGGGNSPFLKPADHEVIKQIFPSAKFDYIPDVGHWVHAENPNEFLKLVTQFLATV